MTNKAPASLHTVTPYFTVDDADRLIAFMAEVFGAQLIYEDRNDDGRIRHARVSLGDSTIMVNESGQDTASNCSQTHVYVDDVDAVFVAAGAAGAARIMEPNQRPHGDRMAGIRDPTGNIWWIAAPATRPRDQ